ncbi:hypothetical protein ACIPJ2_16060 [Curtobacterium sp. NPDC090217]|uniref:phage tail tube protein n=1 Tax=Curtobacterium sp. NPDC090217 TaxID=3363970 RepID=UPI003803C7E2
MPPTSPYPASSASDGRHKIAWVPKPTDGSTVNPLSIAVLATAIDVTYSFTPTGFKHDVTQAEAVDKRYTAPQDLSRGGKTSEKLEVQYVDSQDQGSADAVLTKDAEGWFVRRKYIPNDVAWTKDQLVDVISVQAGVPRQDPPAENQVDTTTQGMFITQPTAYAQKLVA